MRTYTVKFKTMDGNFHKERVTAASRDDARAKFWSNQRGRLRHSGISYIIDINIA
jgi:hypothetical protein